MRTKSFFAMALFAVLLTSTWGIASALDDWQVRANEEAGTSVYTDDAVGTGSMPDSSIDDASAKPVESTPHESLGTGSMDSSSSEGSNFFTPLGIDSRPGYDGN
jgi:hypothetical protein